MQSQLLTQSSLKKLMYYLQLMRFHKPVGILLLLWPTWVAVLLAANGKPSLAHMVVFTLGVIIMRAAGCVVNDIADRNFDPLVARTKHRPLAAKVVTVNEAKFIFFGLMTCAFFLVLQLSWPVVVLAALAALVAILYPYCKRVTYYPQVILGIAFSFSILMAYVAVENYNLLEMAWLFSINVIWAVLYDTEYAMTDQADDLKIGIKSTAIAFRNHQQNILAVLKSLMWLLLLGFGLYKQLYISYYASLAAIAAFFIYQQLLIKDLQPQRCFQAFLNNQWVGLSWFLGVFCSYWPS